MHGAVEWRDGAVQWGDGAVEWRESRRKVGVEGSGDGEGEGKTGGRRFRVRQGDKILSCMVSKYF